MKKVSTGTIVTLAVVCIIGFLVVTFAACYFGYNNKEIALRQECEAQKGKVEGVHDAMWKIISQKAQVTQEYKESFDSIYTHIIEGRYSQGDGSLMKWIVEANPEFDSSLFQDVMDAIEQQRTIFRNVQEVMIDKKREHETLCKTYPGKWFISDTSPIEYTVISSSRSKEVMKTGEDNDIELFNK
jgi:hypothetical protein